jgi:hypothetical protein
MVLVKATKIGYYNSYRNVGDEFEVPDDFPESPWWERISAPQLENIQQEVKRGRGRPPKVSHFEPYQEPQVIYPDDEVE